MQPLPVNTEAHSNVNPPPETKWSTPTIIPNTDELSPTLEMLFVVSGIPALVLCCIFPGLKKCTLLKKVLCFEHSPQWM